VAQPAHQTRAMARFALTLSMMSLGASLLVAGCKPEGADGALAKKAPVAPVKVAFVTAVPQPTPELLTLTGLVTADQRSEVTADTQGKVISVMIDRGTRVKMGDPVVKLDVRNAALQGREAAANLENARAQRALAEEECKRTKSLFDKGAITRSEFDRQNTQCTSALQQVAAAQARTEMIAKSVNDGIVRAPFAGEVAEKMVAPGEWVAPGRPLFTLVDDDPLHVELSVPEVAIRGIQQDQKVTLTAVARPGVEYTAKVVRIGAEIGRTRSLIIEAVLDAPPAGTPPLVPGMFAEARVQIGEKARPILPATAVVLRGKTYHAFVLVNGELEERIVQLGPTPEPGKVSISLGIAPNEKVVEKITEQTIDGLRVVE